MIPRLAFLLILAFWVVINVLLWRLEYGTSPGEMSVPPELVWQKILTAPDPSSLTIYQNRQRAGYCEFSTSVEQAMAKLDEDQPPPEGLVPKNGYKLHFDGNVILGDFTNRLRFNGYVQFSSARSWRELSLKLSTPAGTAEIQSTAAKQTVRFKISSKDVNFERVVSFADLQNPNALLSQFGGSFDDVMPGSLALPMAPWPSAADMLHWEARRQRVTIAHQVVGAYRLETRLFDHPIVIYTSPVGEIFRVDLPGGISAVLDEWTRQ